MTTRPPSTATQQRIYERSRSDAYWDQIWAANHKHASTEILEFILERYAGRSYSHPAAVAARHPNLSEQALRKVLLDPASTVREHAARNPSLTSGMITEALRTYETNPAYMRHLWVLLQHPNCPARYLNKYAKSSDRFLRSYVLENPRLPLSAQRILLNDPEVANRRRLARNPNLKPDIRLALCSDRSGRVLIGLLEVGYRDPLLLEKARASRSTAVHACLIRLDLADEELVNRTAASPYLTGKRAAAEVVTDPDTITALAIDGDYWTRCQALRNESCPDEAKVAAMLSGQYVPKRLLNSESESGAA